MTATALVVVADAGSVVSSVLLAEGQRLGVREHDIGMSENGAQVVGVFGDMIREDDIESVVNHDTGGVERFQILFAPDCSLLLVVGRSRNPGKLADGGKVARTVFFQIFDDLLMDVLTF